MMTLNNGYDKWWWMLIVVADDDKWWIRSSKSLSMIKLLY